MMAAMNDSRYADAITECQVLGHTAQQALVYIQRYDWKVLSIVVVACYALWLLLLLSALLRPAAEAAMRSDQTPPVARSSVWTAWALITTGLMTWEAYLNRVPVWPFHMPHVD
jgi:hypothetical protein